MKRFTTLVVLTLCALLMTTSAFAQVDVSTGGAPTTYATLKLAFDAINAGTHTGAITIDITANTTEGTTPATLNSSDAAPASYTSVLIRPTADGVSITGNPATGFGVIQLKGSDNVTIDGDNPNTGGINRDLTVNNTNTTTAIAGSVIRIATAATVVTSANDITIKNCNLNGNVTAGNAAAITSTTGSSNSSFGIVCSGNGGATATDAPTAITSVTGSAPSGTTINNLLIDNNSVNQCARGIVFIGAASSVSTGVTISNNVVGAAGALAGDPPYVAPTTTVYTKAIYVSGANAVTVSGNTIQNILSYVGTQMNGIELNTAIGTGAISIANNTVTGVVNNGTVSGARGIDLNSAAAGAVYSVSNNTVTNVQTMAGSTIMGIQLAGAATSGTVELNKVTNVNSRGTGTFGAYGISNSAGNNLTIRNNFVSDITHNMTGGGAFSTTFGVFGIRIGTGTGHKVYYNSVNLFGLQAGTANSSLLTAALCVVSTASTGMDIRNNALSNTISGGTTSIAHVAVYLPSGGTSAMNLTDNNNGYYHGADAATQGVGQVGSVAGTNFHTSLATLKTYSGALSVAGTNDNASFASTSAVPYTSATNLHIPASTATQLESGGAAVAGTTTDIDAETRNVTTPDIGADEFAGIALDLTSPSISYTPLLNTDLLAARTLTASITDAGSGVPTAGAGLPVLYWRVNGGSYSAATGAFTSGSSYDFSFGGGVATGDTVYYYIAAQDGATSPNVGTAPSAGASGFTANPPAASTPPTTPSRYVVAAAGLAGDYTVGLTLFNRVTGKNITFERVVTRELREVPEMVAVANVKGENSLTASTEAGYVATGRMVMKEVEQISWVPMESGRPYTGELYVKRAENPNLSPDAHAGIYATITAAVADLNLRGVSGATRLLLVDATYPTETFPITVNIQSVNGTSAANTVTIKPSTGVVATVSGAAPSTQIMKILNSYVTIDGSNAPAGTTRDLTLSNTSTTTPQVLVIGSVGTAPNVGSGAKNTVFINGINTSSAVIVSDGTVAGNPGYFNNITFQNNSIQKAYIGMYNNAVVAAGNGSGHSITGNELNTVGVNAVRFVGLYVQGVDGATISGNTIANFDGTSAEDDRAMWLATGTKNVVVEKNFMHSLNYTGTGGYGAYGMAVSTATTGANVEIRNNMIYNLSGDGWNYTSILGDNTHGLYIFSVQTGVKVYYNSINLYGNTLNQTSAMSSGITLGTGSTADIKNNIVVNNLGLLAAIGYGSTGIFLQAAASQYEAGNYNDIHVNPTGTGTKNIGQIATTASTTLADWQTATSQEANSVSADPGFVSNTNLHINTSAISPADSAGTPLAGITTDIDNNTRDAVRPDIGADEFTYVAPVLPPNCAVNVSPADLATNVFIGATLNWASGGGGPTGYKVFFGTDNPPTNIANGTDLGLVTSYDPTPNMAYSTVYYWRIVPYNASGDATGCAIWSFTTEADPTITSFPYAEGFESLTFPPAGWSNQAAKLWSRGSESAFGSGAARSIYTPAGTSILQMPPVALPASHRANFYWKDDDISASLVEGFDTTWFEISTNAGASWTSLALLSAPAPQSSYVQQMVDLSAYGGTTVLLRWRDWTDGTFDAWGIGVDSVRIEAIPSNDIGVTSVDVPSLLAAPSAGSSSSEVSREMASRGEESAPPSVGISLIPMGVGTFSGDAPINFMARIENFGSTTIASYQVGWHLNGTNQTSVNNTAPIAGGAVDSLVLTWASPTEGSHSIRAWTLLGGDTNPANDSSATFTFEVLPANVIFNQAFNGSFPPAGWTTVNRDGGGTSGPWFAGNNGVFPAKEGTGYAGDNYQSANGFYIDDYLISPNTGGLDDALVTDSLTFWLRAPQGSIYNDSLEVRVSTTGSDTSNFTMLLDYIWADTTGAWKRYAYALPNGANRYIAFRYLHYEGGPAGNYSNYIGLDDIRISRYAGGGTVTIGVPVALNWNIVSLPVSSPTPDDSVSHLFTNSINPYAFAFTGSYQQRFVMINAPGYWIKSSAAYTQDVIGTSLDNLTVPVNSGWNMIGSISTAIDTASAFVTPSVPGLRGSNYFRYSAGYVVTNTISPGLGYWVKANSAGSFLMHTTGASRPAPAQNATSTGRTIDDLNSITIRDANGGSQTLYFGTDSKNEIPVAMFVMPPSPPEGSFDARFRSNEGGTMVQVHSEDITAVTELPISLQSSAYPLTVTWQLRGGTAEYELTDGAGGVHPLRGEGAVRINGEVSTIALRLSGNSALPKEFALSQNYPNPFNPTTNITFALPVQSRVTAEIYNMLGQRVSTLVKEDRAAGFHVVEWNGTSTTGVQVGSGTYFLRLSATGANGRVFTEVKKLLMLK